MPRLKRHSHALPDASVFARRVCWLWDSFFAFARRPNKPASWLELAAVLLRYRCAIRAFASSATHCPTSVGTPQRENHSYRTARAAAPCLRTSPAFAVASHGGEQSSCSAAIHYLHMRLAC